MQGRLKLQPYQWDCVNEALSKDENGLFKYSIIVWSDIKKSIKSTIAAAVALYMSQQPWSEMYLIANDLKQADSRVAYYARRAIQLSPTLKDRYRTRGYSIIGNNGSRIEALPIDPEGEAGSNAEMIQYSELWGAQDDAKSRMWCFDQNTEILTKRGWLRHNEMHLNDYVATVNPETHKLEWQKPKAIFRETYAGKMHLYESKTFSKCVTPEHRLYGIYSYNGKSNKYAKQGIMRSNELRESGFREFYPLTCIDGYKSVGGEPGDRWYKATKFKEAYAIKWMDWCELLGWYLSEGSVKKNYGNPVTVRISQEPKVNPVQWKAIKQLMTRIFGDDGFKMGGYRNETSFLVHSAPLARDLATLGNSHTKYIPDYIKNSPPEYLNRFLMAFILGDGHKTDSGSYSLVTGSEQLADDLQEVGIRLGYYATKRFVKQNNTWRVLLAEKGDGYKRMLTKDAHWKEIKYYGTVWCPSVPNGLMITRREGKPCVSGNTEMTLSPTKFGKSFRWVESYAGYMEESLILYGLWETGVQKGELLWPDRKYAVTEGEPTVLEAYANPEARMFCLWNTQPRSPWQTQAYYESEASILHPLEFERMHRNQWITQTTTFVPMEWWDACNHEHDWPEIPENHPMIIAADAGTMKDNFGVIICCNHPDKQQYPDDILVWYARKWVPPKGSRGLDFVGTEENPGPEMEIRRLIAEKNIVQLAYDEYQLHDMMNRLRKDGIVWCRRFPQGSGKHSRTVADAALYDKIRDRKIWHRGEPELREHIQNANAKIDDQERRLRIVKRVEHLKVDLAVGLSMASYEVERLNL